MAAGCKRFYKKIDSTFRGNVGIELEALITTTGAERCMLIPAYPKGGRTTAAGVQYVSGVPLHRSEFVRDPREPTAESAIAAILGRQTGIPVFSVDNQARRESAIDKRHGIVVYDAGTDNDLREIAGILTEQDALRVVSGSAGFAEQLPDFLPFDRRPIGIFPNSGKLLVVCGSLNPVSLGQIDWARSLGIPYFPLGPALDGRSESLAAEVVQTFTKSECVLMSTADLDPALGSDSIAQAVAAVMARIKRKLLDVNMAVFGGDTGAAVARDLGYKRLFPVDEILPGLSITVPESDGKCGAFILKSGGFGPRVAVEKIREYLKKRVPLDSARGPKGEE